ncbi:MAG: hypothetical protein OER86_09975 [Phycisphaerae bacterium]|nr:hypothetical protein [Phycisphaerae bacterium]
MVRNLSLDVLEISNPCPADWEQMRGDHRVRHCDQCQLNVYNISALTGDEALALIQEQEGRFCGRLYRRADGTVITADCPRGIRAATRWALGRVAALALLILVLGCSALAVSARGGSGAAVAGTSVTRFVEGLRDLEPVQRILGWFSAPPRPAVAGKICPPPLPVTPVSPAPPSPSGP